MTSKMSDCIYSGRKLESLQKSGLKTCAGALPLVHEKKNKKSLRQCFSQNGFKSAQEKQTGLMHNTWAEYFIILLS